MKKYEVSQQCISCKACVGVAANNFEMNENNKAFVKNQPRNNDEEKMCQKAKNICPVNAISLKNENIVQKEAVFATSNIKETLDKYPELKKVLVDLSPKFKRMQNPVMYNTLARFANFNDAARVTGLSICEILHTINDFLGTKEKLIQIMPDCIKKSDLDFEIKGSDIYWQENNERYIYNNNSFEELINKISMLKPKENIVILSVENPEELLKIAKGLNFKFNVEKNREYRISIFNPSEKTDTDKDWRKRKDEFEILDVRTMTSDPFDIILKKAYSTKEDNGFVLIQKFEPFPMISMLSEMNFEHLTEKKDDNEFWIYFHKKPVTQEEKIENSKKVDVVIQSATPVAYPVIMRLLQSEKIRKSINIKELKIWKETEKHLAWITEGKADISFSALITAAKLKNSKIKIPALFVWDNFVLLSHLKAEKFEDLIGEEIYTPLFEEAPPAKITKYLIKASGLNPDDFKFKFGLPFGRPEEIYKDFVAQRAKTVILREPEASYAIKLMEKINVPISIISFNKIWNDINKDFGSFPNAGLVLKEEFVQKNPELTKIFLEELKSAIKWVVENKKKSAQLSFDMMRQPVDRIELFLDRVNFEYVDGEKLIFKVKQYFDILNKNQIVDMKIDEKFLNVFKMDI